MDLADPTFVIVLGRCKTGEPSVAQRLSERLGWPLVDARDFDSRSGWLEAMGAWIDAREVRGDSAIVACAQLSADERAGLRRGREGVRFLELDAEGAPDDVLRSALIELDLR